ncbi:hypothetical protein Scep_024196 [Stephania cephalantha]|uniref:Uncharacterized protein n=1 Tax=Stephania cephalantha TaxID=152367 RepID=A0AAP0EX90_9MAGN
MTSFPSLTKTYKDFTTPATSPAKPSTESSSLAPDITKTILQQLQNMDYSNILRIKYLLHPGLLLRPTLNQQLLISSTYK